MDYSILFRDTFQKLGFDVVGVWNVFDPPYDWELGWSCKLPTVDFQSNTVLIMYLQDRVTIINGSIVELEKIANHYGKNANQIVAVHMHPGLDEIYSGPIKLIEFSNHNYDLMNSLQEQQEIWQHIPNQTKTINWQCLNGRMCQHRQRAMTVLKHWDCGILSYADEIPLTEWAFNTYRGSSNEENFVRLSKVYGSCTFNIVTETLYDEYPGLYSEKTLLAFLADQIPIIISTPHMVNKLRAQGFDMFDDIIDHSYDTMSNDCRVEQALALNKGTILSLCNTDHLRSRLEANRLHALNTLPEWYQLNFKSCAQKIAYQKLI
jgi:hypothetical protein